MGLKILHSADWHLGAPFSSIPEPQRGLLRRAQQQLPEQIGAILRSEGCQMALLAGDLLDGITPKATVDSLKAAFRSWQVPVFIAPGNHDFIAPGSPWLEEDWPENVHIFRGGLTWVSLPELDCRVYGAGYTSMDCPPLLQGFRAEGGGKYCICLLHGDPTAKNSPYCPVSTGEVRESGLDYLALGHIHKAGAFRAGDTLCAWPGCPMGRGWDETGEKGVNIVTLDQQAELRHILLDSPRFYTLEADIGYGAAAAVEGLLPPGGNDHFYRLTLTGFGEADLPALKKQFAHFPNLTLIDQTEEDLWANAGEDTLQGVYFRLLREKAKQDPHAKLAAEISRKLLSGREVTLP